MNHVWRKIYQSHCRECPPLYILNSQFSVINSSFDFIIAGGGTAGCVLASRLTENKDVRVLMLEAGPHYLGLPVRIPGAIGSLYQQGKYHWSFESEPEPYAGQHRLPYKLGKLVGGSSAINGLVWVRGSRHDFDGWAASGCDGWAYKDVESVFRRIEKFEDKAESHMGQEGPVAIMRGETASPLSKAFLSSAAQAGYPANTNYHGDDQTGFCAMQRNTANGERQDVYKAYLEKALTRPNLEVISGAHVERVLIDNHRATGVVYRRAGNTGVANATGEVLLCAGALGSPQILQLSGIGKREWLDVAGLKTIHALPGVGENLHTHPTVKFSFSCKQPVSIYPATRFPGKLVASLEWLFKRTGPAASNNFEVGGFMSSKGEPDRPDLQFTLIPLALGHLYTAHKGHGFEIYIELIGCKSRGWTRVVSSNALDHPRFCFNFLKDSRDIDALRVGAEVVLDIVSQRAFAPYVGKELLPGEELRRSNKEWLRDVVSISHHLAGSCRMGPAADPMSVVDAELRVHGLKRLRVVDASIMPTVTSGNTHAPVIMIAERASDMIRANFS